MSPRRHDIVRQALALTLAFLNGTWFPRGHTPEPRSEEYPPGMLAALSPAAAGHRIGYAFRAAAAAVVQSMNAAARKPGSELPADARTTVTARISKGQTVD